MQAQAQGPTSHGQLHSWQGMRRIRDTGQRGLQRENGRAQRSSGACRARWDSGATSGRSGYQQSSERELYRTGLGWSWREAGAGGLSRAPQAMCAAAAVALAQCGPCAAPPPPVSQAGLEGWVRSAGRPPCLARARGSQPHAHAAAAAACAVAACGQHRSKLLQSAAQPAQARQPPLAGRVNALCAGLGAGCCGAPHRRARKRRARQRGRKLYGSSRGGWGGGRSATWPRDAAAAEGQPPQQPAAVQRPGGVGSHRLRWRRCARRAVW